MRELKMAMKSGLSSKFEKPVNLLQIHPDPTLNSINLNI